MPPKEFWGPRFDEQVQEARALAAKPFLNKIPFLGGRPARDRVIGKDDILDLTIALGTARSIEEFITLI